MIVKGYTDLQYRLIGGHKVKLWRLCHPMYMRIVVLLGNVIV